MGEPCLLLYVSLLSETTNDERKENKKTKLKKNKVGLGLTDPSCLSIARGEAVLLYSIMMGLLSRATIVAVSWSFARILYGP